MPAAVAAAVVTTFSLTGTAAAVTTFVVTAGAHAALAAGANLAASVLRGKAKGSVAERQASVTSLSLGEVPREAVFGMPCVGGSLVDVWNWGGEYGTDNVTRCIALADHAVEGDLFGYFVDDVFYEYAGPGVQPGFNGTLTIDFRNATAEGHPPPAYALAAGWEPTDVMTSVTHAWVTTKFDETVWTQGFPRFRFVFHGLNCFDPRNGDVWEDRSTHSFTRNPALMRYAFTRGIYAEGHQGEAEHLLIGRGLTEDQAPTTRLIAAANLCDEAVDGLPRYYADAVINAATDFITVEQWYADAMAGAILQPEGGVEIEPGQAKAAVVTITDGDLVTGEAVSFSRFLPDKDGGRINTVVPRYVSPAQGYVDHSGPVRRDLADLTRDGGPREMTLSMPFVTGAAVADRNAEITRRLARLERRATIVLPPEFFWLEEGDWIAWTSARRHKGATVRYRIESWTLDEQWRMRLTLREIASSVYGVPDPVEDLAEPPPPPVPVDALLLPGVSVQAITLPGETSVIPAVRFRWDMPVDGAMRAIRAEVRTLGQTDVATTRTEDLTQGGGWVVTNGVAPSQTVQARLVPIGDPTRPVLPSVWFTVTTGNLIAGGLTGFEDLQPLLDGIATVVALGEALGDDAAARVSALLGGQNLMAQSIFGLAADIEARQRYSQELGFIEGEKVGTYAARRTTELFTGQTALVEDVSLIGARTPDGLGWLLRADTVKIGAGETLVSALVQLQAQTATTAASVVELTEVTAGQASASAYQLGLLGAQVPGQSIFRLSETSVQVGTRGPIGSILNSLIATDGGNTSNISSLLSLTATQGSSLSTLSSTVGGHTSSITSLFSVTNGLGARYTLALDVNGAATAFIADGATRAILFKAASLTIIDDGNGLSYTPATGRMKIVKGGQKTVLGAGGSLVLWAGSTGIPDGSETVDNGILGIGAGDSYFGGRTLSGPFEADAPGGTVALGASYSNLAQGEKTVRNGSFFFQVAIEVIADGPADAEGFRSWSVDLQMISVAWDYSEQEIVWSDSFGGVWGPGSPAEWVGRTSTINLDTPGASTRSGRRRLFLQVRRSSGTTSATARNADFRGFYAA